MPCDPPIYVRGCARPLPSADWTVSPGWEARSSGGTQVLSRAFSEHHSWNCSARQPFPGCPDVTHPRIPTGDTANGGQKGAGSAPAAAPGMPVLEAARLPALRRSLLERYPNLPPPPPPPAAGLRQPGLIARNAPLPPPPGVFAAAPVGAPVPALPRDVWARIVQHVEPEALYELRHVNRTLHTLSNRQIERICIEITQTGESRLDFAGDPMGVQQGVLFRGDTRPPSVLFALGFTKANSLRPRVSGEKVKDVISTSKDAGMVRRKYTEIAGYLYAVSGFPGIDTRDFNKLDEVAGFFIPPECVIAAIGPVAAYDDENYLLVINNPRVQMNLNCRLPVQLLKDARVALAALCRAPNAGD